VPIDTALKLSFSDEAGTQTPAVAIRRPSTPFRAFESNFAARFSGVFLWTAHTQSGFSESIRRMQCDHKPMMRRKRLDLTIWECRLVVSHNAVCVVFRVGRQFARRLRTVGALHHHGQSPLRVSPNPRRRAKTVPGEQSIRFPLFN
jgi:hypothetical protein